jgi:predicted N-acyltransferase
MANLDALIVQSVADVDPKLWRVAGPDRPFSSYKWYSFCEKAMPACTPAHILLFRDGYTFARGSFWLLRKDVLPISSPLARMAGEWVMKHRPLLVCRSPVANVSGMALPVSGRQEAFEAIYETAEAFGRKSNVSIILYDYFNMKEIAPETLPDRYAHREVTEPGTALEIHWKTFEDYLSSLSRQAWKDYRRHNNQAAKLGIRITCHSAVPDSSEAVDLIRRVENFHGVTPNLWAEAILNNMQMVNGTWIEARQNERLVGCGLLLRDGDYLVATLIGLDYNIKYAYFPLMYCAIQSAINQGVRIFHAGSGAYELKQRLGFVREANNHIVYAGIGSLFSTTLRFLDYSQNKGKSIKIEERVRC